MVAQKERKQEEETKQQDLLDVIYNIRNKHQHEKRSSISDEKIKYWSKVDRNLIFALKEAESRFIEICNKNPEYLKLSEQELLNKLHSNILNFYSPEAFSPYIPLATKGPWIVTFHGGVVYDTGGYGMLGLGHNPEVVKNIISKDQAMANVMTASFSQLNFTKLIKEKIGLNKECPYSHFAFMNSGSEAVEVAARISDAHAKEMIKQGARHFGKKIKYISLEKSFHGRTYKAAQASNSSAKAYSQLASFSENKLETVIPNDIDDLRRVFNKASKDNVYFEMMFMEPVMGEGGAGVAISKEFYREVRKLTKENDTLLLVDSIQAGLRCNGVLSVVDYPELEKEEAPDFETFSKAINAGQYPVSVLALNQKSASFYKQGIYGNTMTGNPRGLDVAYSVLSSITPEVSNNIRSAGHEFKKELLKLQLEFPHIIKGVLGKGLLLSIQINEKYQVVGKDGLERKIRECGLNVIHSSGNRLRFTPWFLLNKGEIELMSNILSNVFKAIEKISISNNKVENSKKTVGKSSALQSFSPINNELIGTVPINTLSEYESTVNDLQEAFLEWKNVPAPKRGQIIREIGEEIRKQKDELGTLVTLETGKILEEGKGEIQEIIDVIDYAVGLSRQLCGNTMQSERADHRIFEQWHPLGVVGVITAFNFPAAVWGWNAMIAAVCGNAILWKPSEMTPLISVAMNNIAKSVMEKNGYKNIFGLVVDNSAELGKKIAEDKRISLVSATGSCEMGRSVAQVVAKRLGKSLLELGGNNAVVVMKDADLDLTIPSIVFGAVGTAGQRCTSTRRVLVQKGLKDKLVNQLISAYKQIKIGNPLEEGVLVGPLINSRSVEAYKNAITEAEKQGGKIVYGNEVLQNQESDFYVMPTIIEANKEMQIVKEETFAPILYVVEFEDLDEAIAIHNNVPQGLSSAIFTENLSSAEKFISATGSDCGIANVNIGTSGAEIGGAFGGEKDTGGGRESGSDSWKAYMRRQTNTINYGKKIALAQGIDFNIKK